MKYLAFVASLFWAAPAFADVQPATFDLAVIRDPATLETKVIQDWKPVAKLPGIQQKLVEITVCEWWPGQKVRLPVTFCVPDSVFAIPAIPCTNVLVVNMGLALKPALPGGAELELLTKHGVGVVMVGMGTIDAMEPKGQLHLGMKRELLKTKDARFTPAWIWGMSDMRGLTVALAEPDVFKPRRVLATGGSKRGVGAAVSGIHDDRFTATMPVVAPILGNPGGAFVRGSALLDEAAANEAFLEHLPPELPATAKQALIERDERRADQSISRDEAISAGWTEAEMLAMNDAAWDYCLIAKHSEQMFVERYERRQDFEFFYHVGTNDNVCPGLHELSERPRLFCFSPMYILPGGQHGGPKGSGFTLQTPTQPEAEENLLAFAARYHFFRDRSLPRIPLIEVHSSDDKIAVTIEVAASAVPQRNTLSWCVDRSPAYTFAAEYDHWNSIPLVRSIEDAHKFVAQIEVPAGAKTVDIISTHTHEENGLPFHFSSPYHRHSR